MKKIFTFFFAALMSVSMFARTEQQDIFSTAAEYYIVGDFNNWDVTNAVEMTTTDGVHYYVHLDTLYGGFKITNARDWNHIDWGAPRSDNSFGYSKHNWYDYVYGALKSNENWESDPNYNILTDQAYSNVTIGFYINNNNQRYIWYDKVTLAGMKVYDNEILYQITNVSPAQVKIIGNYISSPTDLVIPDSVNYNGTDFAVTAIGDQAFQGNDYLTSVTIPESVTTIWNGAFNGCTELTAVTIPENVTTIGYEAFNGCTGLTAVTWNAKHCRTVTHDYVDGLHEPNYSPFPSSVQTFTFGSQVERIPAGLCRNLNQLSTISLPQSLMQIDNYAFMNTGLTSIVIPENLDTIGDCVFWRCNNLSSVNWKAKNCKYTRNGHYSEEGEHAYGELFPNSVQSFVFDNQVERIDAYLCYNLNQVSIVNLPNSLIYIGSSAFEGTGLNSIVIPENVTYVGGSAFFCDNLSLVIWNARNSKVGNSSIQYSYWSSTGGPFSTSVQTFIFGDHVQSIPNFICSHLHQLTSISLPNTVTEIGENAFWVCNGLISVTMEEGVQTIGRSAFCECSNLPQIVLPNTVTKIGTYAFEDCSNLTTVTIGNSVDTIDNDAFRYCNRLISIELPTTVTYIGERAFDGCSAMNKAIVHSTAQLNSNSCLMFNAQLDTVIAPASLFDIHEADWVHTTKKMKYLRINSGVLTENGLSVIRRSASTLETLDVSATTNTTIADEAFSNMYRLTTLGLPQGLDRISYKAVAECVRLQSIDIPAGITEIGDRAFEDCRSLTTITFGGQSGATADVALQTIGNWAFYNNHALRQITIPAGVTTVGDGAFYGCNYLEELAMPASLRNVGDNAFALCNHLTKMQVEATLPPQVAARTFFDVNRAIPVYVPDEAVNDYRTTQVWQEFFIRPISQAATGIGEVEQDGQEGTGMLPDGKFMQNGQLFIRKNCRVYDTQGRLIE